MGQVEFLNLDLVEFLGLNLSLALAQILDLVEDEDEILFLFLTLLLSLILPLSPRSGSDSPPEPQRLERGLPEDLADGGWGRGSRSGYLGLGELQLGLGQRFGGLPRGPFNDALPERGVLLQGARAGADGRRALDRRELARLITK